MSEIDWGALQKEAATAGVIPEGDYDLVVVEATAAQSSTGKPMIKVKYRITDGPQKDKPVWTQFVVSAESPIALRIFFQHMAAHGLDASFFAQGPSMEAVASNLRNRAVRGSLGIRAWNGADRNEIKSFSPPQEGGPLAPGVVTGPPTVGPSPTSPVPPQTASAPAGPGAPPPPTPF